MQGLKECNPLVWGGCGTEGDGLSSSEEEEEEEEEERVSLGSSDAS